MVRETMIEGRVLISYYKWGVIVKCPRGHQLTGTTDMKSFAGSALEARCSDPNWKARCDGQTCEFVH